MIEQELREIASHVNELRQQERMFIEELRVLKDIAGPDLSQRLAALNARMDAFQPKLGRRGVCPTLPPQPSALGSRPPTLRLRGSASGIDPGEATASRAEGRAEWSRAAANTERETQ